MPSKKRATPVSLQPLDALFGTNEETTNGISEIEGMRITGWNKC